MAPRRGAPPEFHIYWNPQARQLQSESGWDDFVLVFSYQGVFLKMIAEKYWGFEWQLDRPKPKNR